jgi:hypothetical protein
MYVQRNIEARSRNNCYRGKAISITNFSVCVCVCVCVRARKRTRAYGYVRVGEWTRAQAFTRVTYLSSMQRACVYCHVWPLWLQHIFQRCLINGRIFEKRLLNIKCVFWFSLQLLSEIFLILRRTEGDIVINVKTPSCKIPVTLVTFSWN